MYFLNKLDIYIKIIDINNSFMFKITLKDLFCEFLNYLSLGLEFIAIIIALPSNILMSISSWLRQE
jgi:hypothetical protein